MRGSRGVLRARVHRGCAHRECREASGMCITTRGQGAKGCRGVGVGVEGVSVSVVGVSEDVCGPKSSIGVRSGQQKKNISWQLHT